MLTIFDLKEIFVSLICWSPEAKIKDSGLCRETLGECKQLLYLFQLVRLSEVNAEN